MVTCGRPGMLWKPPPRSLTDPCMRFYTHVSIAFVIWQVKGEVESILEAAAAIQEKARKKAEGLLAAQREKEDGAIGTIIYIMYVYICLYASICMYGST